MNGSKHVFRALSEAGETELALKMLLQPDAPGFVPMLRAGSTTLWESWKGVSSRNHIMFGDFVAWAYQYLGGIRLEESAEASGVPDPEMCGFRRILLAPVAVKSLDNVSAAVDTPYGVIRSEWTRRNGKVEWKFAIPPGTTARVLPPWDGKSREYGPGTWRLAE